MTTFRKRDLNWGGQIDAGNRLRVSQITTLLDIKQVNDDASLFFDRVNIGGATQTYSKVKGGSTMAVSADGDAAICESKMFAPYFSGKSQFLEITFSGLTLDAGVVKRVGYFNSSIVSPFNTNKDGLWLEADGDNYYFVIEKNGVEKLRVNRDHWDVNPPNDLSKFNVLVVQFLYLGGTAVRFGFITNGVIEWYYTYVHAGVVDSTFIESPQQPIRYEIRSTGGAGDFDQICAMVASEGSIDEVGYSRAFNVDAFSATASGTDYAALGIRLKPTYRNARIDKEDLGLLITTNDNVIWYLCFNPTIAGTFAYVDQDDSALQLATGATANTVSDLGLVLDSGFVVGNSVSVKPFKNSLRLGTLIDGTPDELVLVIKPLSPNLTCYAEITVNELI